MSDNINKLDNHIIDINNDYDKLYERMRHNKKNLPIKTYNKLPNTNTGENINKIINLHITDFDNDQKKLYDRMNEARQKLIQKP